MEAKSCPKPGSGRKRCSENFEVKSVKNSARHSSSLFINGFSPNYTLPTVTSQIRQSLTVENSAADNVPVCHRYKTPSPICPQPRRSRSRSPADGLETQSTVKKPGSAPAGHRSSTGTKEGTPSQALCTKKLTKAHDGGLSRPSSAKTDSSVCMQTKRHLFERERLSPRQNSSFSQRPKQSVPVADSSRCSTHENEIVTSPSLDNESKTRIDSPRLVSIRKITTIDDLSRKSKDSVSETKTLPGKATSKKEETVPSLKEVSVKKSRRLPKSKNISSHVASDKQPVGNSIQEDTISSHIGDSVEKVITEVGEMKSDEICPVNFSAEQEPRLNCEKELSEESSKVHAKLNSDICDANETAPKSSSKFPVKHHTKNSEPIKPLSSGKPEVTVKMSKSNHQKTGTSAKKAPKPCPTLNKEAVSVDKMGHKEAMGKLPNRKEVSRASQNTKTSLSEKEAEQPGGATASALKEKDAAVDEYRAKLAEKRKLAREKAEREAEEERLKDEKTRAAEEERKRREEEEERRRDEEELRLAEESRRLEEARYQKLVEEEELRRRIEAEQAEAEAKAKFEQQQIARQEAERLEKERMEKKKREEEEKTNRKKRLDEIMKRVKTDEPELKTEQKTASPQFLGGDASAGSVESGSQLPESETTGDHDAAIQLSPAGESTTRFKSPLLQQILTGKSKAQAAVKDIVDVESKETNGSAENVKEVVLESDSATEETGGIIETIAIETNGTARGRDGCSSKDPIEVQEQNHLILSQ